MDSVRGFSCLRGFSEGIHSKGVLACFQHVLQGFSHGDSGGNMKFELQAAFMEITQRFRELWLYFFHTVNLNL